MTQNNMVNFFTVIVAVVGAIIMVAVPGDQMGRLKLAIGYGLLILIFLYGFLILTAIATGKIDLSQLLSESSGGASMSRFQLLIFTFVIALSLFLLVAESKNNEFPKIPPEVLALLGISASTYAVSKGIQASGIPPKKANGNQAAGADNPKPDGDQGPPDKSGQGLKL